MRLFEAILDANHRAAAGDATAGLRPDEFAEDLPVVALTCIDPRLNPLMPEVLGIPQESFIWLRNAGNIITSPMSSTMRSLALACAVKGGREIAIIGHTDCLVGKTTMLQLTDRLRALGIDRARLPENLIEFFSIFASERQNVIRSVEQVRASPIIGPRVPVHGLLVDIQTGRLEWVVNGYQTLETATSTAPTSAISGALAALNLPEFKLGEMKFPEGKIGELAQDAMKWLSQVEVVRKETEPPKLPEPESEAQKPPTKRHYEPRPPTIPMQKKSSPPPPLKLQQPWKPHRPDR